MTTQTSIARVTNLLDHPEPLCYLGLIQISGYHAQPSDDVKKLTLKSGATNEQMPSSIYSDEMETGQTVGAHCIGQDSKGNIYIGNIYGERCQKFVPVSKR